MAAMQERGEILNNRFKASQGPASRVLYTLIIFILHWLLNLLEWLEPKDKDTSSRTDAREKQVMPQPDQHAAVSGGKYGIHLWSEHGGSHPISNCHDNTGPKQMPAESASLTNIQLGCSPMYKMMFRAGKQLPKLSGLSHQLPRKQALQNHHQVKPAQTDVLREKVASVLSPVKPFSAPYQVPVDPFSVGPSLRRRTHPPIPQNDQLFSSFVDDFEKLPRKHQTILCSLPAIFTKMAVCEAIITASHLRQSVMSPPMLEQWNLVHQG
ncbi:hypothetical protein Y1Q_0000867 [Alligator mississippiensis]|uniref:Uncharacterized protein n=1 Tax=Alligator mississippiensis TaxID=8496 RepID=A0A151NJM0_ALLMI|nr:hypothetical protein Y1Q_0000867 [Alligator mississippiensis]